MVRMSGWVVAIGVLSLGSISPAARAVVVESVQYPAWLERGGNAVPLVPGTTLESKDRLRTGANARAKLRFVDGSSVKLGENVKFEMESVQEVGLLRASLRLITGAFRYATEGLGIGKRRSIVIHARGTSIGVRGTDLWGKSTDEKEIVCLIEGKISVGTEGHAPVTLDQPLDFYVLPRGGSPTVAKVDPKVLAEWAVQTETSKDGPVGTVGGVWHVTAAVFDSRDAALDLRRRLRGLGYPAQMGAEKSAPFAVLVAGLGGEEEARALMRNLRTVEGVTSPSVGK